jgi:hypothetical protein
MYLDLSYAWVTPPTTIIFASLNDLKIEFMKVAGAQPDRVHNQFHVLY